MNPQPDDEEGNERGPVRGRRKGRRLLWLAGIGGSLIVLSLIAVIAARGIFNITSGNAVLYILRHSDGTVEIKNHVRQGEYPFVQRMIDASCLFDILAKAEARVGLGNIELTWNEKEGDGIIKEFRPDGTELLVVLSRYSDDNGTPQGVFIGGDLPLGDTQRASEAADNNTGIAYYDGKRWNHIWCTLNEGVWLSVGEGRSYSPTSWKYLGSRVLKSSSEEVVIESRHEVSVAGAPPARLLMKRTVQKRRGDDYVILKVEYQNGGAIPFSYSYELGDEPWVGDFYRGSKGNVGWTDGALYKYEGFVLPSQHTFAGYWDVGNDVIHERGVFTGYADFIEWLSGPPDYVYFADSFGFRLLDENRPLKSWNNRVIALDWLNQTLKPGEQREHVVALGMAKPAFQAGVYFPVKPVVRRPAD